MADGSSESVEIWLGNIWGSKNFEFLLNMVNDSFIYEDVSCNYRIIILILVKSVAS